MKPARLCRTCHQFTPDPRHCAGRTRTLPAIHLTDLHVDVTITLRLDHNNQPFLLIQKPSGQETITLADHDLL